MIIALIAAMDRQGVIGVNGRLPWSLPDETQYFKKTTWGRPHIMGRKTFESIGRPLPGRHNIILTRDPAYQAAGCTVVHSVAEALAAAGDVEEVTVGGGTAVFAAFFPLAQRLYLTFVAADVDGDTFFPLWDPAQWQERSRLRHEADERHAYAFDRVVLERLTA